MPKDLRVYIDKRTKNGGFSTPSEYVRHLIREDQKRSQEAHLEELLLEGLKSGSPVPMTPAKWAALKKRPRAGSAKRPRR